MKIFIFCIAFWRNELLLFVLKLQNYIPLAPLRSPWISLIPFDSPWLSLTPLYFPWLPLDSHVFPWLSLKPLDSRWPPFDFLWPPFTPLNSSWLPLDSPLLTQLCKNFVLYLLSTIQSGPPPRSRRCLTPTSMMHVCKAVRIPHPHRTALSLLPIQVAACKHRLAPWQPGGELPLVIGRYITLWFSILWVHSSWP